ncbi:hypothetical protein HELRODRAFT_104401 [Helobdella robusta]|uniref:Myeloid leukemia factor 1 n=1 Tax=Helobdella robusta TaxID=6412 RepID=T1EDL4_HELRO|nr:hypothetical protein HELRODRAFT_104401 [Helobdella robusta]ESN90155.1 hypothetical protein HELRODRAFT_104401 [Helobdella robusta]
MSMFREFCDDPFFGFSEHDHRRKLISDMEKTQKNRHRHGRRGDQQPSIQAPNNHHSGREMSLFDPLEMSGPMSLFNSRSPFSMMDSLLPAFGNLHTGFESFSSGSNDVNGFGYSSMKVSSYVNDGSGPPKVFEAVQSTKVAPGGLKETKKAMRDTMVGVEKMSLGRHIMDKGHVITRQKDTNSGDISENRDYIGFAEEEANQFDEEWERVISKYSGRKNKANRYLERKNLALE